MEVPYTVKNLNKEDTSLINKFYSVEYEYLQVGAKGYLLYADFLKYAAEIYNMQLRPTDVFVTSYPRSGTTLTQELVWLLVNDLDFEEAKSTALTTRSPYLELHMFDGSVRKAASEGKEVKIDYALPDMLPEMSDPRLIKTHLSMSFLPEKILDTVKMVYVARDPRDVLVSCYHFYRAIPALGLNCSLKEYFDTFLKDLSLYCPFWDRIEEAWALRNHPNMLFLFYEDMLKDLKSCAKRVAKFLNKEYSDEQLDKLCEHLRFDNFQKNKSIEFDRSLFEAHDKFIRKGKSGGWREEFDSEMTARACAWMRENMRTRNMDLPWSLE